MYCYKNTQNLFLKGIKKIKASKCGLGISVFTINLKFYILKKQKFSLDFIFY